MGTDEKTLDRHQAVQRQLAEIVKSETNPDKRSARLREIIRSIWNAMSEKEQKAAGNGDSMVEAQVKALESPWVRFFWTFDPRPTLAKVHCPVLALNGEKDLQVPPKENLTEIEKALKKGGNMRVTVKDAAGPESLVSDLQDRFGIRVRRNRGDDFPGGAQGHQRLGCRTGERALNVPPAYGSHLCGSHNHPSEPAEEKEIPFMSARWLLPLFPFALVCLARADGPADNQLDKVRPVPPKGITVAEADRAVIQAGIDQLGLEIDALRKSLKGSPKRLALLPDVQIYHNAVRYALTYNEFFNNRDVSAAKNLLKQGLERAKQLSEGKASWNTATGLVVRGYVSRIDGSVQPYGLVVPESYQPNTPHLFRLDVWCHGRGETLSEVNFIDGRQRSAGEFTPPNAFVLHPYGRYLQRQQICRRDRHI